MKNCFLLLPCFLVFAAQGQNVFILGESNFSSFNMSDFKSIQRDFVVQSGLPLKIVDQFPTYFGWGGVVAIESGKFSYGLHGGYTSTGGRVDYEDYSGLARFDQSTKCYWFGPYFQAQLTKSDSWPVYFNFRGSYIHSKVDMNSLLIIGTSSQSYTESFYSWNYGFRPEFSVRKKINRIFIQASAGYEFQVHGKLYLTTNHNAYLRNSNGSNATAQWDGLRFSVGIGFFVSPHQNKGVK